MRKTTIMLAVVAGACGAGEKDQSEGTPLDISVCGQGNTFSPDITNRFFPQPVGQKLVLEGGGARVEISALGETEVVGGVVTRVVHEYETEGGELVEQSWNYFAQAADGTVCYFGERVDIYEGGVVVAHDGEWRADQAGYQAGIIMPAQPAAGTYHAQERAPGIAEDFANIVEIGRRVSVPAGTFEDTVITDEWSPLEPGAKSHKAYAAGVGLLDDNDAVLVEIVRPQ